MFKSNRALFYPSIILSFNKKTGVYTIPLEDCKKKVLKVKDKSNIDNILKQNDKVLVIIAIKNLCSYLNDNFLHFTRNDGFVFNVFDCPFVDRPDGLYRMAYIDHEKDKIYDITTSKDSELYNELYSCKIHTDYIHDKDIILTTGDNLEFMKQDEYFSQLKSGLNQHEICNISVIKYNEGDDKSIRLIIDEYYKHIL